MTARYHVAQVHRDTPEGRIRAWTVTTAAGTPTGFTAADLPTAHGFATRVAYTDMLQEIRSIRYEFRKIIGANYERAVVTGLVAADAARELAAREADE